MTTTTSTRRGLTILMLLAVQACSGGSLTDDAADILGPGGAACEERVRVANESIESVRAQNLACSDSSECTLFEPSTRCRGACPVPVSVAGLAAVERAVERVNETTCRSFIEDGCLFATPACLRIEAECQAGQCVAVPQ